MDVVSLCFCNLTPRRHTEMVFFLVYRYFAPAGHEQPLRPDR